MTLRVPLSISTPHRLADINSMQARHTGTALLAGSHCAIPPANVLRVPTLTGGLISTSQLSNRFDITIRQGQSYVTAQSQLPSA